MEIKDLTGFGKPLAKLIGVISRGVGKVSAPYLLRRQTGAKVDEIEKIAAAIRKVSGGAEVSVTYRDGALEVVPHERPSGFASDVAIADVIPARELHQARVRQENVEAITSIAAEQLVGEEGGSEDEVDQDWINRFFRYAEDVSSEEMRKVWARLLAGEVLRPGSFSLRTMEFMRGLSVAEARKINVLASVVLHSGARYFFPVLTDGFYAEILNPEARFELSELGLVFPNELALTIFAENGDPTYFRQGKLVIYVKPPHPRQSVSISIHKLTVLGIEVMQLLQPEENMLQLETFGKELVGKGCAVELGEITGETNGKLHFNIQRALTL